jgi:hypothetical protein
MKLFTKVLFAFVLLAMMQFMAVHTGFVPGAHRMCGIGICSYDPKISGLNQEGRKGA